MTTSSKIKSRKARENRRRRSPEAVNQARDTLKGEFRELQMFTTEEVAKRLRYHHESIRRAVRQGRIHAVKTGALWRVPAAELERIVREGLPMVESRAA